MVNTLQGEVAELRQQNEDLFKIQQRILYIFSRYMRASQNGQVAGGNQPGQVAGGSAESSKRIRSNSPQPLQNNKRQRLLMESKPDSPNVYHSDNYESNANSNARSNGDYPYSNHNRSGAAAASSSSRAHPDDHIVDLNTDSYTGQHGPDNLYGQHALSDLNWASDPVAAINDLISKSGGPLQQVLNSTTGLPMQMGRAAQSNAIVNHQGGQNFYENGNYARDNSDMYKHMLHLRNTQQQPQQMGRGGRAGNTGRGGAAGNQQNVNNSNEASFDLGSLGNANPKQLLELLDRMGADGVPNGDDSAGGLTNGPMSTSNRGRHQPSYNSDAISGVFEDVEEPTSMARGRNGGRVRKPTAKMSDMPASSLSGGGGRGKRAQPQHQQQQHMHDPLVEDAPYVRPTTGGATLSPLEDEPAFPLKNTASPVLGTASIPASPIPVSPFIHDESMYHTATTPSAAGAPSYSGHFDTLRSPSNALLTGAEMPSFSRGVSTNSAGGGVGNGLAPIHMYIDSPFHAPQNPLAAIPSTLDLQQPLTPNMAI
jgi:hypothetical protein